MELEFDEISGIWEKDVNNYVFRFASGKLERKGDYVKERSTLDYDLPIVTEAVVRCITEGIPVRKTIEDCDSLKEFQMIKKISSKYSHLLHGGHWEKVRRVNPATGKMKTFTDFVGERKRLKEKCVRVYASKDPKDGGLWKVKTDGSTAKVEGTPEHCFMVNDDVNDMCCPRKLDKEWYIRTAQERVEGFGL
jgi:DNA polymerase